jgi:hypothetical protein
MGELNDPNGFWLQTHTLPRIEFYWVSSRVTNRDSSQIYDWTHVRRSATGQDAAGRYLFADDADASGDVRAGRARHEQRPADLVALFGITTLPRSYGETWLRVGVH